MNFLITGANGYIGSKLIEHLLGHDCNVLAVYREDKTIIGSFNNEKLTLCKQDLTKQMNLTLPFSIDVCIHLAASNDTESASAQNALEGTVLTTKNILEFCRMNSIPKIIYYSTFQVYGSVAGTFNEQRIPEPTNDYGITHYFAEQYIQLYSKKYKMEYVILRPTNIYGAPISKSVDRWSLVPGCFCLEAINTGKIVLMSSGKQIRDFVNLNDLVKFTKYVIDNFTEFSNSSFPVYSGNKFSILEIANLVREEIKTGSGKECDLEIKDHNPLHADNFDIFDSHMQKANFKFENKDGIKTEITKTLKLIKGL